MRKKIILANRLSHKKTTEGMHLCDHLKVRIGDNMSLYQVMHQGADRSGIFHLGVSKNTRKPPKWIIMENPIKMDDLGVPLFLETPTSNTFQEKFGKFLL